jgi:hypothetical protein
MTIPAAAIEQARRIASGVHGEKVETREPEPIGVSATPFVYRDPTSIPRREFLFGRHAVRKFVSVTVAAGGTGKTALAMVEATAFVTGKNLLCDHLNASGRAWYIGLEDPLEEYERRLAAIMLHHKIAPTEIEGGLFLDSGRTQDFVIGRTGRNGVVIAEPVVNSVVEETLANQISLIHVDPFVACHSVNENDNSAIEQIIRQWARVADQTGAAVELVHHVRKLAPGEELSADAARGAKSLIDAARSLRLLVGMTKEEAEQLGIEERRRYFRVINGKANLWLPPDQATWRQLATVALGNGNGFPDDLIQVADWWEMPKPTDGVSGAAVDHIVAKIGAGEYRADAQAKTWAGQVVADVLSLDLEKAADKSRVKSLLRLWVENGALRKERRKDGSRQERDFIVPGVALQHHDKV